MGENDIRGERLKHLELLKRAGYDPYPAKTDRDRSVAEFLSHFTELEKSGERVTIAGRMMVFRRQGGINFADVFDGTARAQIVLQKENVDEKLLDDFIGAIDAGDFIEATGVAYKTKSGKQSLLVERWKPLAKSLLPIPTGHFGVKDEELRLRQRYLDILLNDDIRKTFERRAKFWQSAREFYLARGFLEVETPVLETTPGGADARPFVTHHNALDIDVFLRISCGELWQKELLVAGFPKVFEIGRIFRNEGQSREHLQDYTQLESYEAYADAESGMGFVQELYRHVARETYGKYSFTIGEHSVDLAEEWPVIDFNEAVKKEFGLDPLTCREQEAIRAVHDAGIQYGEKLNKARAVDHLWKKLRKQVAGPAFLRGVPAYLSPLAKNMPSDTHKADRVQVIMAGSEVGNGYSELNDPQDQKKRFEEQQKLRDAGDDEAQRLDEDYVRAMEYGMPPAFGFGVSERLFAFFEDKPAHEAQLFPLLRPKAE